METVQLLVLDMAGTTVQDNKEVETCFAEAARQTGLLASEERILAVQGMAKRAVFEMLWQEQTNEHSAALQDKVEHSYQVFRSILEHHYHTHSVKPTEGCLELFRFLKKNNIKIALTTGFYRQVTNIILEKLGWLNGLDKNFIGNENSLLNMSIASDEVEQGRPSPFLIQKAMRTLGITDSKRVINIGDTPSDLASGFNANCAASFAVTNGTHTREQLQQYPNDGLFESLTAFQQYLKKNDCFVKLPVSAVNF
ncbi:phosphatase [Adhaeribacter arboris]|uniref:Phosphatase n=1 Tax=Adhaeribacter arboris TaxID=2072846 RepID=A0A2T2YK09_9BACT|nr:HAD hydrolase-like protein [Adhaeribacter arboris]PSR55854.1 phosphatase [Adhaeribacter arboris]